MRICLHTVRELAPDFVGGTERHLIEMAKELTFLGHDPFILTTGTRGAMKLEGVSVLSTIPKRYLRAYARFGVANTAFITSELMHGTTPEERLRALGNYVDSHINSARADIIHLNSFATSLFSNHARGAVVTNHENQQEYDRKWGKGFTDRLARIVRNRDCELKYASLLTTPSEHYAEYYSSAFNLPVRAVRNGISLTTFSRQARRGSKTRSRSRPHLSILVPARFDPHQKGHDVAMAACRMLIDRGHAVDFTFSGVRPDYRERLGPFLEAANSFGISRHVRAKYFADIQTALRSCDIVVSPERFCSYGLSISEALALGIPTVLSDIPTYVEIATDYAHAKFFPSEDAEALADAVLEASRIPLEISDQEAIRFRIANDLRTVAVQLHKHYVDISQSRIDA